jgi:glycosyltransferase involved in cell wall biosynthesis
MKERPYISLIVPAYNERLGIGRTIAEARSFFEGRGLSYEIIVAADGDDGTREHVAELAAGRTDLKVLGSVERRGKGHGIRQAVQLARGRIIGYTDADNKTPIGEFDKFRVALDGGCEVVMGSRSLRAARIEKKQKFYRQVGSHVFRWVLRSILSLPGIGDTQCGFKFFQHTIAKDLFHRQRIDGYMFDVEILYLAIQSGYRIEQVPIRWRDDGDSRLQVIRGNLRNILDVLKIRFTSYPRRLQLVAAKDEGTGDGVTSAA